MKPNILQKLFVTCLFAGLITDACAQFQGPMHGTSYSVVPITGSSQTWSNGSNTGASDNSYATTGDIPGGAGAFTDYLIVTGFNFNIPIGAAVTGILVEIEQSDASGLTSDHRVRIIREGTIGETEKALGNPLPGTDTYRSYGGNYDMWAATWTFKNINDADFGVAISFQRNASGGTSAGQVDDVRITVYYTLQTLPVHLVSFSGVKRTSSVILQWATQDESNMDKYEVERSSNGKDFYSLASINSQNNSSVSKYSFSDTDPLLGRSWYRLKMTEFTGSTKFSHIISVDRSETGTNKLYPSLLGSGQNIFINNPGHQKLKIRFYNTNGELVSGVTTSNDEVSGQSLATRKGVFIYKVFDKNETLTGEGRIVIY